MQVAGLDPVGIMLVLADPLADHDIAGFHELDEQAGGLGDMLALRAERAEKIRHLGEYPVEELAENGGLVIHGLLPI